MNTLSQNVSPRILLLGVGNILYADEGLGVHAARYLEANYSFSSNVTLLEGGVLGRLLLPHLLDADVVIIMDAVLGGSAPGTSYRLTEEALRKSLGFVDSQHQVDLVDILIYCELAGHRPHTIVIGMEPQDITSLCETMTEAIQTAMPAFIDNVLKELAQQGGQANLCSAH